jgi:hypothetical protein
MVVAPANEQDRAQVGQLAKAVQAVVEEPVQIAFVDQWLAFTTLMLATLFGKS